MPVIGQLPRIFHALVNRLLLDIVMVALVVGSAFALTGPAAAHPASTMGMDIRILSIEQSPDEAAVLFIDLEVLNGSATAKTLRGFRLQRPRGRVFWTRGRVEKPAQFARIDVGETWRLANRFNPLRVELVDDVVFDPRVPMELELDFGPGGGAQVTFTQQGVFGLDYSHEENWFFLE